MSIGPDSSLPLPAWIAGALQGSAETPTVHGAERAEERLVAALVERSRRGSHEAYREIVERYEDRLYRFCLGWTGNPEDAEELCQDTFVRAYSALPRYRSEDKFSAWLYRIARNRCHDHHRSRSHRERAKNRPLSNTAGEELVCPAPAPDENIADAEELARLLGSVAALPESLREAVVLCGLEGLSQEQCAEIIGCSRRAVEGRLYRARAILTDRSGEPPA